MSITPLPTPPSTNDPANFAVKADALLAALPAFVSEANDQAAALTLNATNDTSSSSVAIGTGAKTFTVSSGKSYQPGMYLVIADAVAPAANSMVGQVTGYSGTSLVIDVQTLRGSGTKSAWVISQSAPAASSGQWLASGLTPTHISTTSFTLAGDQTSDFHVGRRLQFTVTAGTVTGTILTSAYAALTTVTMTMDSGQALDSGLSAVNLGFLTATGDSMPRGIFQPLAAIPTDVSGSRTVGVNVTNTSGKQRSCNISMTSDAPATMRVVLSGGGISGSVTIYGNTAQIGQVGSIHLIVPDGVTYNAAMDTGASTIFAWVESV